MTAEQLAKALRDNFSPKQCDEFFCDCANGLAAELKRKTVEKTPIGNYSGAPYACDSGLSHKGRKIKGKRGGTLRKSWHNSRVTQNGNKYVVTLKNTALSDKQTIPYGQYVEFGHRLRNGGSVAGHKMLTNAAKDVRDAAQGYLEKKLDRKMRGLIK